MRYKVKRIRNIHSTAHALRFSSDYKRHLIRYPSNTITDKGYINWLKDRYVRKKRGDL